MKPSTPFLAFLLFFLFAFGFAAASETIRDIDGNPLADGGTYYVYAGGAVVTNSSNGVVSGRSPSPITITTAYTKYTYLLTVHAVTLNFANYQDSYWVVEAPSFAGEDLNIVMGNLNDFQYIIGHFFFKLLDSEKFQYTLEFCRSIANASCNNVVSRDIYSDPANFKRLVVTNNGENESPVVFQFKQIKDDEHSRLSMVV